MSKRWKDLAFHRWMHREYADEVADLERQAEHLQNLTHCNQRVVDLLVALRFIMSQRPGSAHASKEGLRERLRNIFASARLAIALEEKEEQL